MRTALSPLLICSGLLLAGASLAEAASFDSPSDFRDARNTGRFAELAAQVGDSSDWAARPLEAWIAGEGLLSLNRSAECLKLASKLEVDLPRSLVGAFLRFREALHRGDTLAARQIAKERVSLPDAVGYGWGRQSIDWVLLGRLRLAAGEDAKSVLQSCYERALRDDVNCEEAHEAIVELALERGDSALAADKARAGLKKFASNARLHSLLGSALEWSARKEALASWRKALELNNEEVSARIALARFAFQHEDAELLKEQFKKLPEWNADARALRLAEWLGAGDSAPALARLKQEARSPYVLHGAGMLLSGRYRFAEGAKLQRKALELDPSFLSARRQLAEDLLRLGQSEEAWPLLEEVHRADGYDVTAYNLLELRDRVAGFVKIETPNFEIWMSPSEAPVYGDRVSGLLEKAYAALTPKYRCSLKGRTRVEIFPEQKDFAVRTFGVPGGDGYLGVCFGPVITAPSPAAPRAAGHSWEATLWHEFTHTVTLSLTGNRMPRWLSEGISVFEEQQANPGWGRRFKPRYVSRLLNGGVAAIEEMSDSFRSGDAAELDFAYLQAGLVVEWLIKRSGMNTFRGLLSDIGRGVETDEALSKHYGAFVNLNPEFRKYAADWTRGLSGNLVWRGDREKAEHADAKAYEDLLAEAKREYSANRLEPARQILERLVNGAPLVANSAGAIALLSEVYRALGLESEEAQAWEKALQGEADLQGAHERLIALHSARGDWAKVASVCELNLGINPMALGTLESLWKAYSRVGNVTGAADACARALALDAAHAPRWHSRIGLLLEQTNAERSRFHLLAALEVNPRDQAALAALRRLVPESAHRAEGSQKNAKANPPEGKNE